MKPTRTCFVGQGPNQTCWRHGLALALRFDPSRTPEVCERLAEDYARRVAITGSVGEKLARLCGIDRLLLYRDYGRFNLNARFNGKVGKGDRFDRDAARIAAALLEFSPDWDKYVLLGAEVCRAFDVEFIPLTFVARASRTYMALPHPSGVNPWWNDAANKAKASRALRDFLQLA